MFNLELYELLRTGLNMLRQVYPTSERNCISSFTTTLVWDADGSGVWRRIQTNVQVGAPK